MAKLQVEPVAIWTEPIPGDEPDDFSVTFHGADGSVAGGPAFELPAGKVGTWELSLTVAQDIPAGGGVLFQRRGFLLGFRPQDYAPLARDYVTLEASTDATLRLVLNTLNQVFVARTSEGSYLVARGAFPPERAGNQRAGFLVAANLTDSLAPMGRVTVGLPILGIFILAVGLIALMLLVRNFLNPLVKIDQGLQQVIAGNRDYTWDVSSKNHFTTEMAHALNVMSCFLQGKPLPDDDLPEDDSEWAALLQFADVEVTGSHPAINVKGIAQAAFRKEAARPEEPIEQFYRRIFDEYVAARKKVDPNGEAVTYDRFVAQVKKNAAAFQKKHECSDVRFEVVVKDQRVLLKPVPIK